VRAQNDRQKRKNTQNDRQWIQQAMAYGSVDVEQEQCGIEARDGAEEENTHAKSYNDSL